MSVTLTFTLNQPALEQLAARLASISKKQDVIALSGDLGAGKTTFARAFIRSLLADPASDVPSPTFSLVQSYPTARFEIFHFDFYRLSDPSEVPEIGFDEAAQHGLVLVEWPEKGEDYLPNDRLDIKIEETERQDERQLFLQAYGSWEGRLGRFGMILDFLQNAGWAEADWRFLQGDASARAYIRVAQEGRKAVLMDAPKQPDGPPIRNGKSYSAIAHLAEDVTAFVAVGTALRKNGVRAPEIYAKDLQNGLLLIEDLGDGVFGQKIAQGADIKTLYKSAVDVLIHLRNASEGPNFYYDEVFCGLPEYDNEALSIEVELLLDWYWKAKTGEVISEDKRTQFLSLWKKQFDCMFGEPKGWVLRDYHSPNLILLDEGTGVSSVGVIDFQDAQYGSLAYDLVSLLQDARLTVPEEVEAELFAYYCEKCFSNKEDEEAFRKAYALMGAQRNTKILGIFARLAMRDGKRGYLAHIPRIWSYLERNLAHPDLSELRAWYDRFFPKEGRKVIPEI